MNALVYVILSDGVVGVWLVGFLFRFFRISNFPEKRKKIVENKQKKKISLLDYKMSYCRDNDMIKHGE